MILSVDYDRIYNRDITYCCTAAVYGKVKAYYYYYYYNNFIYRIHRDFLLRSYPSSTQVKHDTRIKGTVGNACTALQPNGLYRLQNTNTKTYSVFVGTRLHFCWIFVELKSCLMRT